MNGVSAHSTQFFGTDLVGDEFVSSNADRAILIVHGLAEHRGRYAPAVIRLQASDFACFVYDQRGHGESPGVRTDIVAFSEFESDLTHIASGIADKYPELPLFIWGHSMGSLVVMNHAIGTRTPAQGIITTGSPLRSVPGFVRLLAGFGHWVLNKLPPIRVSSRLNPKKLSHDESVQDAYRNDPLVTRSITLRLVWELACGINKFERAAGNVSVPWLAAHGGEDRIAPKTGSRILIDRLGSVNKELVVLEGLRHEVHNESPDGRERFFALLCDWVEKTMSKC